MFIAPHVASYTDRLPCLYIYDFSVTKYWISMLSVIEAIYPNIAHAPLTPPVFVVTNPKCENFVRFLFAPTPSLCL